MCKFERSGQCMAMLVHRRLRGSNVGNARELLGADINSGMCLATSEHQGAARIIGPNGWEVPTSPCSVGEAGTNMQADIALSKISGYNSYFFEQLAAALDN